MTIQATIVADSISPTKHRITTFQLRYPRFIHAELMTHRVFSRNASSSRAIPVEKMIEDLRRDPAMPVYWGSNQKGMQAGAELDEATIERVQHFWLNGMESAIHCAHELMERGLHKQIANRILEPWAHINVVVTATDYQNFFALRCHPDAQPEIHQLAVLMREEMRLSIPRELSIGEWHLPYAQIPEDDAFKPEDVQRAIRVSVARCARVSYLTHDGRQTTWDEDIALYERLVGGMPLHASPAEHQATPDMPNERAEMMAKYGGWSISDDEWEHRSEWGNFQGWRQFRKMLPGEFTPG